MCWDDALRGPAVDVLGPASNVTMPYYIKNPNSVGYDPFDDNYDGTTAVVMVDDHVFLLESEALGVGAVEAFGDHEELRLSEPDRSRP